MLVALALAPDGERIATGHTGGWARLWDIESGELLAARQFVDPFITEPDDQVAVIAFSPDSERLAWTTREGSFAELVDAASFELLWQSEFQGAHFGEAMPIAWSPDGSRVWYAFECGSGLLLTATAGARPRENGIVPGAVPAFAGGRGATVTCGSPTLVDATTARMLWRRVEVPGGVLLQASTGHLAGTLSSSQGLRIRRGFEEDPRVVDERRLERLYAPKRVRAAQAGVRLVRPEL
jgi:hypothetical protein